MKQLWKTYCVSSDENYRDLTVPIGRFKTYLQAFSLSSQISGDQDSWDKIISQFISQYV